MSMLLWIFAIIVTAILLGVVYFVVSVLLAQNYWKERNVYTLRTRVPVFGHMANMFNRKMSFTDVVHDFYKELKDQGKDFGGIYTLKKQGLIIIDPKLIGEATIKQFDHFVNRRPMVDQSVDRLLGRSLLGLQNDEWREMRHHLSPAFTGSKLRGMIGLVESTCDKFSNFLSSRPDHNEPLDLYTCFRRMAADVIASTAFGFPSDSINDSEAEFYKNGIKMMDFSGRRTAIMMGYFMAPAFMKFLNIPFVPKSLSTFFKSKIESNIEYREKENKSRADMIQLLLDARRVDPDKYIDDSDIASQAFTFFLGGFDTMATGFSFLSHRLALHPEIQTKVRDEVIEVMEKNDGKMTYDSLKDLKYMDMVIAEVLRMHPLAPLLDRMCTKNVTFPDHDLQIEEGTSILIPTFGLHFDADYFPDPDKFDPERFSEENKANIKPFTYLPFGEGPRNCIGKRFALLELKLGMAKILSKHELLVCEKTNVKVPFEYKKAAPVIQPEGGFWLNIKPISEE